MIRHGLGNSVKVLSIRRVSGGLFNTSYKVALKDQPPVILRIAPPKEKRLLQVEKDLLKREVWIYDKIRSLGFPIPSMLAHDFFGTIIDRDYAIFEYKSGKNLFHYQKHLSRKEMEAIYAELGNYAHLIHDLENEEGWFGYPQLCSPYRKWSGFIRDYLNSLQDDMEGHPYLALPPDIPLEKIIENMTPLLNEIKIPHFIHGDLWLRNILVEKEKGEYRISAILDWDRSLYGDPYFEWVLYGAEFPLPFWQAYRKEKPVKGSRDYVRTLLYKACGGLQAALEESIHFGAKKHALQMLSYSIHDFRELKGEYLCV